MGLVAAERETTLTLNDEEKIWYVYSSRRIDITRFKKNADLVITEEGDHDGTPYLFGTLPDSAITRRKTSGGAIKRPKVERKGMPSGAAICSGTKKNGQPCGSIAAANGRCGRHPL